MAVQKPVVEIRRGAKRRSPQRFHCCRHIDKSFSASSIEDPQRAFRLQAATPGYTSAGFLVHEHEVCLQLLCQQNGFTLAVIKPL